VTGDISIGKAVTLYKQVIAVYPDNYVKPINTVHFVGKTVKI
jgi:hypothetical protein